MKKALLVVNFGGPRTPDEITPFLISLLTDKEVIRTPFPKFFHDWFFTRIAKKRAKKVSEDYATIGGASPIYFDTEKITQQLRDRFNGVVLTFHRYLPATHAESLKAIADLEADEIIVLPLFPQFSFATTGSIAKVFEERLPGEVVQRMRWIPSYSGEREYISAIQNQITEFLEQHQLLVDETVLLYSCHGVPKTFICGGDPYKQECETSFQLVSSAFPRALNKLSYQSQFGKGEWLKPATSDVCSTFPDWADGRKNCVIIPLSFTTDHIETLFEIEDEYISELREHGANAIRMPALNFRTDWLEFLSHLVESPHQLVPNAMLVRDPHRNYCRGRSPSTCPRCS